MTSIGFEQEEFLTARGFVLNPNSGEWIKGLSITLAEMGLVSFNEKVPRTADIFSGIGSKGNRRKYIINRIAFIRAYFDLLGIKEVVVYRGMSGEDDFKNIPRTYLPTTFSLDVVKEFSDFNNDKYRIAYLVKLTVDVNKLFMTHLETREMHDRYQEKEAILLYNQVISL